MVSESSDNLMDKIVALCKRRGFVYPGSEIYGGLTGTWDYGPLGVELKNNIRDLWWKFFVRSRRDMYGVESAILMNPKVWEASGHVGGFSDPLVECGKCKKRFRPDQFVVSPDDFETIKQKVSRMLNEIDHENDNMTPWQRIEYLEDSSNLNHLLTQQNLGEKIKKLAEKYLEDKLSEAGGSVRRTAEYEDSVEATKVAYGELGNFTSPQMLNDFSVFIYLNLFAKCENCRSMNWSTPRQFNMMFQTHVGPVEDATSISYLRPETAQGMFVNFKNVVDSFHPKLPFGIAQIGKAFRNEIAPRDFLFRAREFEIMEFEYFIRGEEWEKQFEYWQKEMMRWIDTVGITVKNVHEIKVPEVELAHYSRRTTDLYFDFPFGQKELYGIAYRTDFDLKNHATFSGQKLEYSEEGGEPTVPHIIEPTFGLDRTVLAVLCSAYAEDEMNGEKRVVLKLKPALAPVKVAVFPLLKNKPDLVKKAQEVYQLLCSLLHDTCSVAWDDNGNIGKRYRRQDEIGTPFCITIDFDSLEKNDVTVRARDTGKQERVQIEILSKFLDQSSHY